MSDEPPRLSAEAVALLLEVLDLEEPFLNGAVAEMSPGPVGMLRASGLLVPHGHEIVSASLADHDDAPVTLVRSEHAGGLAYFSPSGGLIAVPAARLTRHRVEINNTLAAIGADMALPSARTPRPLIEGMLWEIGDARLGKRPARVQTWFARRMWHAAVRAQVSAALQARPYPRDVIILCSSRAARLRGVTLPGTILVPIRDVLPADDSLAVSGEILDARMRGVAVEATPGPLDLSPDGTRLRIRGGEPIVFKSASHIDAICKLVEAFKAGKRVPISELTDHGTLHRHFGGVKWKLLKPYLTSAKGAWGFDL
jgi:hypothetical protein